MKNSMKIQEQEKRELRTENQQLKKELDAEKQSKQELRKAQPVTVTDLRMSATAKPQVIRNWLMINRKLKRTGLM